jgi:tetratricopeptide (TPR) repeat protein
MAVPEESPTEVETATSAGQWTRTQGAVARIGPYGVIRELGRGGMGAVYLAGRADAQYQKLVAIKVIQSGHESEEMLRRFRQERQILAGLDHPNIAKLLDGGATPEDLPYFVMDYVEGEPIDTYCSRRVLPLRERLALFRTVCAAVAHAHRNLVVHRDIKPSNILVTREGVPKLMDFGIAKLLPSESSLDAGTGATQFAFTPAYASPEQVRGERVTTATDVYSLGVVLYELLTGRSPYRVKSHGSAEMLKAICEQEPAKPSTTVARGERQAATFPPAERQRRRLRGDLDSIVLKALRKEPQQRYASVDALSEDVAHYLDGRPVAARKGTFSYRAGKFVRRHWIGVAASLLVVSAIAVGAVLATYGLVRARRAEAAALREAAKATAINTFLQETLFSAQPHLGQGREARVIDALAAAVPKIDSSFRDQPEIRAAVQHTIGRTYADLGLLDEAEPLLEQSLATRRRLLGSNDMDVAESLHGLGALAFQKGDYATAETRYREALEVVRRARGEDALEVGQVLNDLAMTLQEGKADYDGALPLLERSLAIKRAHLKPGDPDLPQSLNNLGMVYYRKKNYAKAEPLLREALERFREVRGDDNADVGSALNNVGLLLRAKGDYRGAAELHRQAVEIDRKVYGAAHAEVGGALNNLAFDLQKAGDLRGAEALLRQSLIIYKQAFPKGHIQIPTTENLLGGCLTEMGRYSEAEPFLTSSYTVILSQFGPDHPRTQAARGRVVALYEAWGKPQKAAALRLPKASTP